jgi:hypothetical protein
MVERQIADCAFEKLPGHRCGHRLVPWRADCISDLPQAAPACRDHAAANNGTGPRAGCSWRVICPPFVARELSAMFLACCGGRGCGGRSAQGKAKSRRLFCCSCSGPIGTEALRKTARASATCRDADRKSGRFPRMSLSFPARCCRGTIAHAPWLRPRPRRPGLSIRRSFSETRSTWG